MRLRWYLCLLALVGLAGCQRHASQLQLPDRQIALNEAAAARIYDRWAQAFASSQASVNLMATEEELTSLASASLTGTPVESLSVWVDPRGLTVSATIRIRGLHTVTGLCQVETREGAPYCLLPIVAVNGRPIPRLLRLSIQQAINDALADANLPILVERVTLGEGYLQITTRPN